jgi:hypothetical protein
MSASSWGAIRTACLAAVSRSSAELIRSSQGYGISVVSFFRLKATTSRPSIVLACASCAEIVVSGLCVLLPSSYLGHSFTIKQVLVAAFAIFTSAYCFKKWRQVSTYLWKYYGRCVPFASPPSLAASLHLLPSLTETK